MVIPRDVSLPRLQSDANRSDDGTSKPLISPFGSESSFTPLSRNSSRQTNSLVASSHSIRPVTGSNRANPATSSRMARTETQSSPPANACVATEQLYGDFEMSASLPSKSTLEKVADLRVLNVNGSTIPFKSLYWSHTKESKRVVIIFIRHFFCGNCQEYLRTLGAAIPPSSLPPDTSIRIVGCGSHTLIPSYIEQTKCPYPVYADPTKELYDVLGMVRTLSLGHKDPDYIQHTLVSGMVKSIAQGLKRIPNGDVLHAGDMKQVGGEFLLEVMGGNTPLSNSKPGNGSLKKVEVTWCHRMKNTRDHAELPELEKVLGLEKLEGEGPRQGSEPSWRKPCRTKAPGLSWSISRKGSRSAGQKESHEGQRIHTIREATTEDGALPKGQRPVREVKG